MKFVKINMFGESMDSTNEINELMDLHGSYGSFKEVNGKLVYNENMDDLLDAYEYETDIFGFEVMDVMDVKEFENKLQYLEIYEVV